MIEILNILVNIIMFEIHIWHFLSCKPTSFIFNKNLMRIYGIYWMLYMQNPIWSLLQ
jgi:hypothetical protein